jgi:predicted dehydrogenase
VQALKRDIMDGVLGRAIRLKSVVFFPRPQNYFRRNDWAGRIRTPAGNDVFDSPVNNATSHYLHNMFYVLGKTRETSAMPASVQAELYRANEIENYDTAAIRCRTECGTELLFYTTHAVADRVGPRFRYEFEKATVEFDAAGSAQFIARFADGRVKNYGQPNHDRHEKIWQSIDAVRSGKPSACGIQAAMAHTLCVVAAQESSPGITNFPARLRRLEPFDGTGESLTCIDGLAETLLESYDRNLLPSELASIDWALAGTPIDLGQADWSHPRRPPVALPV